MHDALVKPMPGKAMAPSLAESWTQSKDGLVYEFVLRKNVRFHNGDVMTAEDVKFSFERYRGASAALLKGKVAKVEALDPHRVRFTLKQAWPDFLAFYATPATGAAWIVPRKYVEQVGDEGFKKAPGGRGAVQVRLVQAGRRADPGSARALLAKDPGGEDARAAARSPTSPPGWPRSSAARWTWPTRSPGRSPRSSSARPGSPWLPTYFTFTTWLVFTEQWDPKSPWHDRRVRLAANLAIDRAGINQAVYLGPLQARALASSPRAWSTSGRRRPTPSTPRAAKQLLVEAGYPNGFDAGDLTGDTIYGVAIGEPVANYLQQVGIRLRLRPMERVAFFKEYGEKKLRGVIFSGSGAPGNAPTRLEQYAVTGGRYAYGAYPDVDGLYTEQVNEMNPRVRQQILHKIQQLIHEKVMFGPVIEPAFLNGVGPRLEVHGLGLVANHAYSAPYEDLRLKKQ